ncbi:uncharacterized protein LOC143267661 [Peromyscus maniculatus bairdii]|uniref:uncharacterized protein LOC143267661 n=1 Tax=Peromyscus maniculatus bairdii TaxID=230844 RepID=UPI003FD03C4A
MPQGKGTLLEGSFLQPRVGRLGGFHESTSRDWGSSRRELGAHGSRDGEGLGEAMLSTNEGLKLLQIKETVAGRKQPSHEANTAWKTAAFLGQVNGNGLGSWWAGSLQDSRTAKGGMLSDRELLLGEGNEKIPRMDNRILLVFSEGNERIYDLNMHFNE